jgi:hypothetical protein
VSECPLFKPETPAAGYRAHQRRGEKACRRCKVAWNKYIAEYRQRKGRK